MTCDKTLIDKNGEEYPYSESLENNSYYYQKFLEFKRKQIK